ncbi:actin family protein [Cryptosporidium serpentis]
MSGKDTFMGGEDVGAIIFDIGSYMTKIGYGGEDCPRQIWPSVIGIDEEKKYYPLNFLSYRENISVEPCYNIVNNNIQLNTQVFEHIIETSSGKYGLGILINEHPILLTEQTKHNRILREKEVEILFEKFDVPALYLAKRAVLSAFAVGRSSGLVVDIGAAFTSISPVIDGYTLQKCTFEYPIAGDFLDKQICKYLNQDKQLDIMPNFAIKKTVYKDRAPTYNSVDLSNVHNSYINYGKKEVLRNIKESICRCAENEELAKSNTPLATSTFELPDGTLIDSEPIGTRVSECLFNPEFAILNNNDNINNIKHNLDNYPGLCIAIANTVIASDVDIRRDLLGAVILTGGTSILPGLTDRISKALIEDDKLLGGPKLKIISPNTTNEKRFSSWIGASILASLGTFQQMWMSKQEYLEHGSHLAERKCA